MASLISNMANEIFQILKGSGRTLSLYDEYGNKVYEPASAKSFFAEPDKLMLSIDPDGANSALNMYVSDSANVREMSKMIDSMRNMATRYNYLFNIRKYGKDLNPKDFAFKALPMMESMWGSTKTSYQNLGSTKLIIRHSDRVSEDVRGSRSRKINAIFVETSEGERFKFPTKNLHGARAFAKHIDSGGRPHDEFSQFIFNECDKQHSVNIVRARMKRMQESSDTIDALRETLANFVAESKSRISRLQGNRFYSGVMEQIQSSPNVLGAMSQEIKAKQAELVETLGLDETDSLFPILESVAKTILEMNQMNPLNFEEETLLQTYVFESEDRLNDLLETLEGEFGYERDTHFVIEGLKVGMLDESVFDNAQTYMGDFDGFSLTEEPQDKFLTYARQWNKARGLAAGADDSELADIDRSSAELASGLKDVIAGRLNLKMPKGEKPRFTNKAAEIAYKLNAAGEPGVGMQNDALANYVSNLAHKISHGESIDANERFFAQRIADIVDNSMAAESILPEERELDEWAGSFDEARYNPYNIGDDEVYDGTNLRKVKQSEVEKFLNEFSMDDFFNEIFDGDIDHAVAPDESISRKYLLDMLYWYASEQMYLPREAVEQFYGDFEGFLDAEIIPYLKKHSYDISESLDEAQEIHMNDFLRGAIANAIEKMDSGTYYGILSGDDAQDDLYALIADLKSMVADELGLNDLVDYADEIMSIAKSVWGGTNESLQEAESGSFEGNQGIVFDQAHSALVALIEQGKGPLTNVTAEWFDPAEGDPAETLKELADEAVGTVANAFARDEEFDWAYDFIRSDAWADLHKIATALISQKYGVELDEEAMFGRNSHTRQVNAINFAQVQTTLKRLIMAEPKDVPADQYENSIFSKLRDDYSYSIPYSNAIRANEMKIRKAIQDAYSSEVAEDIECDGVVVPGDQGDDFVYDTMTQDALASTEADALERLRKLAGI